MAVRRWSVNAAFPTQQPLRLHVERMTQLYQLDRVQPRAPALPARNLFHTVACQFGKLAAVHMGLGHRTGQALADPLLLGSVVLMRHRRASHKQMKRLMMTAAALALTATAAIAKELPDCDSDKVLATLQRVTSATTVVEAKNIRSTDPENLRYCKAEVLTANGRPTAIDAGPIPDCRAAAP